MDEQRKWFLEEKTIPGEADVKIVEMITKSLEYYINCVDKTVAVFERIDSNFKRSSTDGKCYQTASYATEKLFAKGRVNQCSKPHCCLIFLKLPVTQPSANTALISQQPLTLRPDPPLAKGLQLIEGSGGG